MKTSFDKIINSPQPVLVDFYADWCGPCKAMAPILKNLAQKIQGQGKVIKIDVDKNPSLAQKLQIRSIPTFAVYQNGKLLWLQAGMQTESQLLKAMGLG